MSGCDYPSAREARKAAAERVKEYRADPAVVGMNTRLEQLAAAMDVRLQAQEAHVMQLASELASEREHAALQHALLGGGALEPPGAPPGIPPPNIPPISGIPPPPLPPIPPNFPISLVITLITSGSS